SLARRRPSSSASSRFPAGDAWWPAWRAFWLTVLEGRPPVNGAASLGLSPTAVHVAKARVQHRLKEQFGKGPDRAPEHQETCAIKGWQARPLAAFRLASEAASARTRRPRRR